MNGLNVETNEFLSWSRILFFFFYSLRLNFLLNFVAPSHSFPSYLSILFSISFCLFCFALLSCLFIWFVLIQNFLFFSLASISCNYCLQPCQAIYEIMLKHWPCVCAFFLAHVLISLACFCHAWMAFLRLYLHSSWADWWWILSIRPFLQLMVHKSAYEGVSEERIEKLASRWMS